MIKLDAFRQIIATRLGHDDCTTAVPLMPEDGAMEAMKVTYSPVDRSQSDTSVRIRLA